MLPQFGGAGLRESRDVGLGVIELLIFDRGEHSKGAVASLAVVEDL
jgi:hypothetical protein